MKYEYACEICKKITIKNVGKKYKPPRFCSKECANLKALDKARTTQFIWHKADKEERKAKVLQNFYRNIIIRNDCWGYDGTKDKGYARIEVEDRKRKPLHVVSWEIHNGCIPKGMMVLHSCHCRECCRPSHLRLGTHKENMKDMVDSDRQAKGSKHGMAKLNEVQVREIKILLDSGVDMSELSEKYKVTKMSIYNIKKRKTWKHITIE
jgi:hypothetical protein